MNILAIDTSTEACSAALLLEDTVTNSMNPYQQHNQLLLPMLDALLSEAKIALNDIDVLCLVVAQAALRVYALLLVLFKHLLLPLINPLLAYPLYAMAQGALREYEAEMCCRYRCKDE